MKSVRVILLLALVALMLAVVWACSGTKQPTPHFSAIYVPPSSLTVAQWYIDPQNSSTCASDQNNGTSSTCGGSDSTGTSNGPMLTAYGLVTGRWSCQSSVQGCPRIPQTTTITYLTEYVKLEETISSFERLVAGEFDQYPEQAFFMQGAIDGVVETAQRLSNA